MMRLYFTLTFILFAHLGWSLIVTSSSTLPSTCNQCNGAVAAYASGGVLPYSYSWSNGANYQGVTGLCAGTYTVTVSDANGATATSSAVVLNDPGLNMQFSEYGSYCTGVSSVVGIGNGSPWNYYSYQWNTGSTSYSTSVSTSGAYIVTVTALTGNGCVEIDTIHITFHTPPSLNLTINDESCMNCCNGSASASVSGGSGAYDYYWNTGAITPSINSLCPGAISIFVEDTVTGCLAVDSGYVMASSCYSISGTLTQGDDAVIYLIQENSGFLSAIDSTNTDSNGHYMFANICNNGTYYVKGALLVTNSFYGNFLPTYYASSALWVNATPVVVNNSNVSNVDFSLIPGANQGGAGFVGGNISQGANRGEGDPVVGAVVMAYDEDGNVTGFDRTDASGNYQIDGLSYGKYSIYVDILNKTSYAHEVTLSVEHPNTSDRNFEVQGNVIKPITPNGIEVLNASSIRVYPNPTQSTLNVNSESVDAKSWAIYNILGERVMGESSLTNQAQINIDVQNLPDGNYILQVETETGMIQERIMKI
ncbi:MAG: carboxypeptidase regulatory-like domain-containing protein [Flavobacteriales bacterium]